MNAADFVYNQVYKGALAKGAKESKARDAAIMAVNDYKKSRLGGKKVSHLIERYIKEAKRKS